MGIMKIILMIVFLSIVFNKLRDQARKLIELIKNNDNFISDKYDYLKVKDGGVMLI